MQTTERDQTTGAHAADLTAVPDTELIRQSISGDEGAIHALLERHDAELRRYACSLCRHPDDGLDLLHNAIVKSIEGLQALRNPGRFVFRTKIFINKEAVKANRDRLKTQNLEEPDEDFQSTSTAEPLAVGSPGMLRLDSEILISTLKTVALGLGMRYQRSAVFMLDYFDENGVLPSVRTMARTMRIAHSSAQRTRWFVLEIWKGVCQQLGLDPNETFEYAAKKNIPTKIGTNGTPRGLYR